jgi:putative transposase
VFCPKYRYRIFSGEVAASGRQQIYQLSGQKEKVEILELNIRQDHIHRVIEIPPKYAVSSVLGCI